MTTPRCRERIPDNGDDYACDSPLPCAQHPTEEVAARLTLEALHQTLDAPFAYQEKYTDRLRAVMRLLDDHS